MTKPRVRLTASGDMVLVDPGAQVNPGALGTSYVAASDSDPAMQNWNPPLMAADSEIIPDNERITGRSRDLARNNPLASGYLQTVRDNVIGHQLKLNARPDTVLLDWTLEQSRKWSQVTEAQFRTWAETTECDAARVNDLLGLSLKALTGAMLSGRGLAIAEWIPRKNTQWSTRLKLIEVDRLGTPPEQAHNPRIRDGIQVNKHGVPTAYYFRQAHPGDDSAAATLDRETFIKVPAFTSWGRRRVIDLYDATRAEQHHAVSAFASTMRSFHVASKYEDHELHAAAANALIAATLESTLDQDSVSALFNSAETKPGQDPKFAPEVYWRGAVADYKARLQSGAIIPLPVGAKLNPFTPNRPNSAFADFMNSVLRHTSAGLNIPYELLVKDFSDTNYSSARAAMLEAWRWFMGRRTWMISHWFQPVYSLWMEEAVDKGRVAAADFYENRYAYLRGRWIFAGRGWVDPSKEADAAGKRMQYSISTLEKEAAEQGENWEEMLDQQAIEQEARRERGLAPPILVSGGGAAAGTDGDDGDGDGSGSGGGGGRSGQPKRRRSSGPRDADNDGKINEGKDGQSASSVVEGLGPAAQEFLEGELIKADDTPLHQTALDMATVKALGAVNIRTRGDVLARKPSELLKIRNISNARLSRVMAVVLENEVTA